MLKEGSRSSSKHHKSSKKDKKKHKKHKSSSKKSKKHHKSRRHRSRSNSSDSHSSDSRDKKRHRSRSRSRSRSPDRSHRRSKVPDYYGRSALLTEARKEDQERKARLEGEKSKGDLGPDMALYGDRLNQIREMDRLRRDKNSSKSGQSGSMT